MHEPNTLCHSSVRCFAKPWPHNHAPLSWLHSEGSTRCTYSLGDSQYIASSSSMWWYIYTVHTNCTSDWICSIVHCTLCIILVRWKPAVAGAAVAWWYICSYQHLLYTLLTGAVYCIRKAITYTNGKTLTLGTQSSTNLIYYIACMYMHIGEVTREMVKTSTLCNSNNDGHVHTYTYYTQAF